MIFSQLIPAMANDFNEKQLTSRVNFHIKKHFIESDSILYKSFHKFLHEVLTEEYKLIRSNVKLNKESVSNKSTRRSLRVRKQSEYVLFCRFMKEHHPEQKNLQTVWKSSGKKDWLKNIKSINEQPPIIPPVSNPNKLKFKAVINELKILSDEDPLIFKQNILRSKKWLPKVIDLTN